MKIIPLKEGNFSVSPAKVFTLLTEDNFNEANGIRMSVQPFLIITEKDYILLDTGIGWKNENGQTVMSEILEQENIRPEQITKILFSHLHKDHIEGTIRLTDQGFEPVFPKAELYIQKRELDFARENPDNPQFDHSILEKIIQLPHIVWMDDDQGNITDEISYEVVGGHTPYLQVFWITENEETAFYGSDNLPQESYLKYHVAYKSDYDGRKAKELRQLWQEKASTEHWNVLLYHDLDKKTIQF